MSLFKIHLFSNYGWYASLSAVIGITLSYVGYLKVELLLGIFGGILSFVYFFQKQKLKETSLFRELFEKFNQRYSCINEGLNKIAIGDEHSPLSVEETLRLYDYFNLCAEEYLYFKRGYILPEVWQSWYNGMVVYYKNHRIRTLWDSELKSNSYSGFKIYL